MVEQVPEIHFSGNIQPIKGVGVKWNGVFLHFFITKLMIFQTSTASLLHFTLKYHHKYMYNKEKKSCLTCPSPRNARLWVSDTHSSTSKYGGAGNFDLPTWPAQWWQFRPEEHFLWHKFRHIPVAPKWAVCYFDPLHLVQPLRRHGGPVGPCL